MDGNPKNRTAHGVERYLLFPAGSRTLEQHIEPAMDCISDPLIDRILTEMWYPSGRTTAFVDGLSSAERDRFRKVFSELLRTAADTDGTEQELSLGDRYRLDKLIVFEDMMRTRLSRVATKRRTALIPRLTVDCDPTEFIEWLRQCPIPMQGNFIPVGKEYMLRLTPISTSTYRRGEGASQQTSERSEENSITRGDTRGSGVHLSLVSVADDRMRLTPAVVTEGLEWFIRELLQAIARRWPETAPQMMGLPTLEVQPSEPVKARRRGGSTVDWEFRGEVFKRLKTEHPEWNQETVGLNAREELGEQSNEHTVRNTYRRLGWKWERADRIR